MKHPKIHQKSFKQIILKPNFIKELNFSKASYNSIHGEIKAEWRKINSNTYEYFGAIPANCKAKVVLPNRSVSINSGNFKYIVKL